MKEFLARIKADFLMSSFMCIVVGIVLIICKDGVLDIIGTILSIALIIVGIVYLSSYFLNIVTNGFSVFMGIIVLAVGIWFVIWPSIVVSLIPIVLGIVLIFHGTRSIFESINAKKYGFRRWNIAIILSIISIIFGVLCVVDAFGMMEKAIMLVGFILIFNGVTNIWVALTSSRAETLYKKNETIDVEFNEDKEN